MIVVRLRFETRHKVALLRSGFCLERMPYLAMVHRILVPALNTPEIVPLILLCPMRRRYGTGISMQRSLARVALICISIVQPKFVSHIANSLSRSYAIARNGPRSVNRAPNSSRIKLHESRLP